MKIKNYMKKEKISNRIQKKVLEMLNSKARQQQMLKVMVVFRHMTGKELIEFSKIIMEKID